ncbi:MAG: hypothetical protein EBZ94_03055 [Crocinitomicaceae bacterium]|nr:hypothetical protein [Crocinitomicaceae bacterium]
MYYTPKYKRVDEGFFGGVAQGSGHPDCLRTIPESSELLDALQQNKGNSNSAEYVELQLLLSKLACLKKDLMSISGIVDSTRYQAFETAHDRISVAEVCAQCLSQTLPARELDIIFETWRDRANVLLRKLSTRQGLNEERATRLEVVFNKIWNDVYEIAKSRCLKTDFTIQNGGSVGGDVGSYQPENLTNLRSYTNKYGEMSASGWNG